MALRVLLAALSLPMLSLGMPHPKPKPGGVLGLSLERRQVNDMTTPSRRLRKRDGTVQATLYNDADIAYIINTTVGTPPQNIGLQLDTGSSDFWVPWITSDFCQSQGCPFGAYDAGASSTFVDVGPNLFNITYGDGSTIYGDYATETVTIGDATIEKLIIGVASEIQDTTNMGIVGVAYDAGESIVGQSGGQSYPNIISQMVAQGVIATKTYSLWLDDLEATTGSILFGGVDSGKYTGDLVVLPLQDYPGTDFIAAFFVEITGLAVLTETGDVVLASNITEPILLDSGTAAVYLPDDLAAAIANEVGAVPTTDGSAYTIDCSIAESGATVAFQFGSTSGPIINAPISQFVVPVDETTCVWGIFPAGDGPYILGDTFLRSAYVVYNIDANTVAIANTNFDPSGSNVQAITDANNIPGAIPLAN